MKPILFNTEMVRAILDGRKTTTRRVIKPQPAGAHMLMDISGGKAEFMCGRIGNGCCIDFAESRKLPYLPGDILYVRETWRIQSAHRFEMDAKIEFKAGGPMRKIQFSNRDKYDEFIQKWWNDAGKYHPSIHMPREAARIFLRGTDVKAERLQDITEDGVSREGHPFSEITGNKLDDFALLWNSTVKKSDLDKYGWNANPWVWVISFEQCERPSDTA